MGTFKKVTSKIEKLEKEFTALAKKEGTVQNFDWEVFWESPKARKMQFEIRELKKKADYLEIREIQGFANNCGYSDVTPFEVVKVISDKCVEVRQMDAKQTVFPKDFHVGGFSAHCADNFNQKYEYSSNENFPIERIRWSEANRQWQQGKHGRFKMCGAPVKHYDYNF